MGDHVNPTRNLISESELRRLEKRPKFSARGPVVLGLFAGMARADTMAAADELFDRGEYLRSDRVEAAGIEASTALEVYRAELTERLLS